MTNYRLSYSNASTQYLQIEVSLKVNESSFTLQLPAWRPGRYELGNFAKNVKGFKVEDANGNALPFQKITKDCWEVETAEPGEIKVTYQYYANQLNAGSTWLAADQLYVNPVNCCLYAAGYENNECKVEVVVPASYQLACGVAHSVANTPLGSTYTFVTKNFDELADSPFIASATMQHAQYEVQGTTYHLWFQGECKPDLQRVAADFKAFTEVQVSMMGTTPVKDYHFLFQIVPTPFHHGVEHLTTTVIALGPAYKLMQGVVYEDFLGVSSHELFHVWNIKTIRPAEMLPYDFTGENYFDTGFVAEGVTTYYGDVFLLRSKAFNAETYLGLLADTVKKYQHNYGRFNYSVAQSGYDSWLDGYTPGIPHRKVSIYNEGCLLAFMLDVLIRLETQNTKSLDDVMRRLYNEYGLQDKGYFASDYNRIAEEVSGADFSSFFNDYVFGLQPFNDLLNHCLNYVGLELIENPSKLSAEHIFGFKTEGNKVGIIAPQSPAENAGLMIGDTIIAVNNMAVQNNLHDWVNYFGTEAVKLTVNTIGMVREVVVHPGKNNFYLNYQIKQVQTPTEAQTAAFKAWAH